MSKISNALNMLNLLSSGKKFTIKDLSKELEISPRMVRVYKDEIEKAGIYIDTIRGPYGGYILNQNISIPNRKFTLNDINLLKKIHETIINTKLSSDFTYLIDKINSIYIESRKKQKDLFLDNNMLNKFNVFNNAIKNKKKVKIIYFTINKGERERIIYPYDLFFLHNNWGVAAYCEYKKDIRHFEFNRIINFKILEENYE